MISAIRPYFAEGSLFDRCSTTLCNVIAAIKEAVVQFFQRLCPFWFKQEEPSAPARPIAVEEPTVSAKEFIEGHLTDLIEFLPEESMAAACADLMVFRRFLERCNSEQLNVIREKVVAVDPSDPALAAQLEQIFSLCHEERMDSVEPEPARVESEPARDASPLHRVARFLQSFRSPPDRDDTGKFTNW